MERQPHSKKLLETHFAHGSDPVLVINDAGHITAINRALELHFGYAEETLLGAPVEVLLPVDLRETHAEYVRAYLKSPEPRAMGVKGLQLRGLHARGHTFPVSIQLNPVVDENGLQVIAVIHIEQQYG